ncbi:1-acyl-sn-glycerol-3-phosphate acyltransferase [Clostridia bacterium]|nr:1-acyl-sn-glycerol-3-phosphate acyltransferase [Clostridia bacterium]
MEESIKAPDRLAVLQRIAEYERNGFFDLDVEDDPPGIDLDPEKVDFLDKRIVNKVKTRIANYLGKRFFEKILDKKHVVFRGVSGLENLEGYRGGAIVTCNHCHRFDNYAVYLGLKKHFKRFRLYKVVREGNYAFPGKLGFILRNCDTLPVGGDHRLTAECMKAVKTLLDKNKKVLVYPEQGMWWNYKKPRPLKRGAFLFAAKSDAPIIPCFITLKDCDKVGEDGFPVQEFTLHILPLIRADKNLSVKENCDRMRAKNFELWKNLYEKVYGEPLRYGDGAANFSFH